MTVISLQMLTSQKRTAPDDDGQRTRTAPDDDGQRARTAPDDDG